MDTLKNEQRVLQVDDDGVLKLPDDLIEELGWKLGDTLEWIDNEDGTWTLRNVSDDLESVGEGIGGEGTQEGQDC
jgi:bifunctional DNA-binding transcriptional regulator/antitoxin component of YhaV-PrlF toxin-antitoxin module